MISLGIDASVRSTGLTVITPDDIKVKIIKPGKLKGGARLSYIYQEFTSFMENLQPSIVIMEGPSYHSTNKPFLLGEVYGLFKLKCSTSYSLEILLPSPKELKKYLCGTGDATKIQMVKAAGLLGCPSDQEDICDSFSAALMGMDVLKKTNTPRTRKALEVLSKYT